MLILLLHFVAFCVGIWLLLNPLAVAKEHGHRRGVFHCSVEAELPCLAGKGSFEASFHLVEFFPHVLDDFRDVSCLKLVSV